MVGAMPAGLFHAALNYTESGPELPAARKNSLFFVLGLPRSRTAWMANFLTHGNSYCDHDLLGEIKPEKFVKDLESLHFQACGSAETSAILYPGIIPRNSRVVIIHRPVEHVHNSLLLCGVEVPIEKLQEYEILLNNIQADERLDVDFEELNDIKHLERIWNFATYGQPFNVRRAFKLINYNVQITADEWKRILNKHSKLMPV